MEILKTFLVFSHFYNDTSVVTRFQKLTELDMLGVNITGNAIQNLPRGLLRLWLDKMGRVTEKSLQYLPNQLTFLGLADPYRIEEVASYLPTTLRSLHFGNCTISRPVLLPPNLECLEFVSLQGSWTSACESIPPR